MGEGDGDVGEDVGGVGVDCGDDYGPGGVPAPPEEKGRGGPSSSSSLTSSLDGRRVSPLVLGLHGMGGAIAPPRLDLSLSVSAFWNLPFHRFFYNRRSITPIGLKPSPRFFFQKLAFLRQKNSSNRLTGCPRGSGAPPASWPPRALSRVDSSSQISQIFQKYSLVVFIPFGLHLIWVFCET